LDLLVIAAMIAATLGSWIWVGPSLTGHPAGSPNVDQHVGGRLVLDAFLVQGAWLGLFIVMRGIAAGSLERSG
jgi:hypothetical protein